MEKSDSTGKTPMIERRTMEATELEELKNKEGDSFNPKEAHKRYDYVIMFADAAKPTNKEGNAVDESSKAFQKWKELRDERRKLIKALCEPDVGLIVTKRWSQDKKTMYLLVTASQERLEAQAEEMELEMKMKEKHGGGYAPFEVELKHLFEDNGPSTLFRKTQRIFLILAIMEGDKETNGASQNLDRLVQTKVVTRVFPLHEPPKLSGFLSTWASPKVIHKNQPIDEIRDYFGEEIALYFAWLGFYTFALWILSIIGVLTTFFWAVTYFNPTKTETWTIWSVTIYCVVLSLWATLFLEYWKRYNNELNFRWGMQNWASQERERPDFWGETKEGVYSQGIWIPFDKSQSQSYGFNALPSNKYYPTTKRRAKMLTAVPLITTMVAGVVVATFAVLSFRLFVQRFDSLGGSIAGGIVNAITIIIMNGLWKTIAVKLTNWENHRTDSEYENALIIKIFVFYFFNSYTSLFYIAFWKGRGRLFSSNLLTDACKTGRLGTAVLSSGCMDELTLQLVTILLTNMFVGQSREVAIPWLIGKIKLTLYKKKLTEKDNIPQWESESKKPMFPGTFDEYSEMVIQYGYITMFAASFPLAPVLAALNNVVEIRTDALKLLTAHSRPEYKGSQSVGFWYGILEILGIISVVTNCLLIGFSLNSVADAFGGVPTLPSARRVSQVYFQVFVVIVILEHILFIMKFGVAFVVPDVPGWITKELAKQEYIKNQTLKALEKAEKRVWKDTNYGDDDISDDEGKKKAEN